MLLELILGGIALTSVGTGIAIGLDKVKVKGTSLVIHDDFTHISDDVRLIIALLDEGKDWKVDSYTATHPTGVQLWISSGEKYLKYVLKGSVLGAFDMCNKDERRELWLALEKMLNRKKAAKNAEASKEFAQRVLDYHNGSTTSESVLALPRLESGGQSEGSERTALLAKRLAESTDFTRPTAFLTTDERISTYRLDDFEQGLRVYDATGVRRI